MAFVGPSSWDRVRGGHGLRGTPCTVCCHRGLLRRGLLRDTSTHQDSASTPRSHFVYNLASRLVGLNTVASFYAHLRIRFGLKTLVSFVLQLGLKTRPQDRPNAAVRPEANTAFAKAASRYVDHTAVEKSVDDAAGGNQNDDGDGPENGQAVAGTSREDGNTKGSKTEDTKLGPSRTAVETVISHGNHPKRYVDLQPRWTKYKEHQ